MPNPNKSFVARLGRIFGRRTFSSKGAIKVYRVFHASPGVGVQPYRSTSRLGDFVKMNAATSLSRAVSAGVIKRVARGRYRAVRGAFSAGHPFWGNQYTKIMAAGSHAKRLLTANRARLNRTMISWAARHQKREANFSNVRWVSRPIPFSFFAKRARLAGKVTGKSVGWTRHV